ncbi:hypothetical protein BpHYR1_000274 [Brachionus plicatilis]|uniref:Uncharacterized protein n=1 Tax=Brachionus plicatilis TaxID=10195 RepID=A0A3M7TAZ3_BRAPC|nr:hypothetical protein BpHYR1_000274 [Brachionus plicatilis]
MGYFTLQSTLITYFSSDLFKSRHWISLVSIGVELDQLDGVVNSEQGLVAEQALVGRVHVDCVPLEGESAGRMTDPPPGSWLLVAENATEAQGLALELVRLDLELVREPVLVHKEQIEPVFGVQRLDPLARNDPVAVQKPQTRQIAHYVLQSDHAKDTRVLFVLVIVQQAFLFVAEQIFKKFIGYFLPRLGVQLGPCTLFPLFNQVKIEPFFAQTIQISFHLNDHQLIHAEHLFEQRQAQRA